MRKVVKRLSQEDLQQLKSQQYKAYSSKIAEFINDAAELSTYPSVITATYFLLALNYQKRQHVRANDKITHYLFNTRTELAIIIRALYLVIFGSLALTFFCTLSLPSKLIRYIVNEWKQEISYLYNPDPLIQKKNPEHLHALTLNCGLLPPILSVLGGLRLPHVRAYEIIEEILLPRNHVDIVCLQEVFSQNEVRIICNGLQPYFAHIFHNIFPSEKRLPGVYTPHFSSLGVSSGLLVAVRHDITILDCKFVFFPIHLHRIPQYGNDAFAHKGIFLLVIKDGQRIILLGNTHLHSKAHQPNIKIRMEQLRHIRDEVATYIEDLRHQQIYVTDTLLGGDFNIAKKYEKIDGGGHGDENHSGYQFFFNDYLHTPKDEQPTATWTCPGFHSHKKLYPERIVEEEVNYDKFLIAKNNQNLTKYINAHAIPQEDKAPSDHLALVAKFKLG